MPLSSHICICYENILNNLKYIYILKNAGMQGHKTTAKLQNCVLVYIYALLIKIWIIYDSYKDYHQNIIPLFLDDFEQKRFSTKFWKHFRKKVFWFCELNLVVLVGFGRFETSKTASLYRENVFEKKYKSLLQCKFDDFEYFFEKKRFVVKK